MVVLSDEDDGWLSHIDSGEEASLDGGCTVICRGGWGIGVGELADAIDFSAVLCRDGPSTGPGRFWMTFKSNLLVRSAAD